jgi:hypothetical protein
LLLALRCKSLSQIIAAVVPQNYRLLRNRVFSENAASKPLTDEKPGFFDIYA